MMGFNLTVSLFLSGSQRALDATHSLRPYVFEYLSCCVDHTQHCAAYRNDRFLNAIQFGLPLLLMLSLLYTALSIVRVCSNADGCLLN